MEADKSAPTRLCRDAYSPLVHLFISIIGPTHVYLRRIHTSLEFYLLGIIYDIHVSLTHIDEELFPSMLVPKFSLSRFSAIVKLYRRARYMKSL